jgi:formate dehydrogenase subunit gamma
MREQQTSKPRGRRRAVLVTVAVSLMVSMALPLTGYFAYEAGLLQSAQAQESKDERAVRGGVEGYSAVSGQETGVLIQNGGQNWRAVRNGPVSFYGGSLIIVVLLLLAAKHVVKGKDKLETRTGRTVTRWSSFERIMHWYVAISFIILAITGLSLIFGKNCRLGPAGQADTRLPFPAVRRGPLPAVAHVDRQERSEELRLRVA